MTSIPLDDLLRCPTCRSPLRVQSEADGASGYECVGCHAVYPVDAGVRDLMPRDLAADSQWSTWQQHLEAFQQRRETRIDSPKTVVTRLSKSGGPQQEAFARFTGITSGVVLDVGCGPGKLRFRLPEAVHYIGLDPIPLPEVSDFDFVRALAEYIPLADDCVDHVTVLSALDHFNDCEAFFAEVVRVLRPGGRVHLIQQVHEPAWSVRGIAHHVKDLIEDRLTKHDDEVPHHMTEFHDDDLRDLLDGSFVVVREQVYSISRTAPRRLFISAEPVVA